jgi:copper chaperone CopZ
MFRISCSAVHRRIALSSQQTRKNGPCKGKCLWLLNTISRTVDFESLNCSCSSLQIEFAVQMTCQKCVDKIRESLSDVKGIGSIDISLDKETVIVETSLPSSEVQQKIESTGRRAVLKGYGGKIIYFRNNTCI